MFVINGRFLALAALVAVVHPTDACAEIIYNLKNGGILEDAAKDATATFPADDESNIVGTITTIEVVKSNGSPGGTLNENAGSLGINDLGGADDRFNGSESWTFSWDIDTTLDFIEFEALTGNQLFLLQSPAWVDKTYSSSNDDLSFAPDDGQFTFANDGTDKFDLTSTLSGDSLLVSADIPYTLSFDAGGDGGNAGIDAFTFSATATAVPEPGSAMVMLAVAGAVVGRGWHRKRKNQQGTLPFTPF